jgi:beta-lactamase class D
MKTSLFALLIGSFLFTALFAACSSGNVTVDNSLQHYFDSAGVKGSFSLFDNGQGHFTIYNLPRYKDSLYQPGSTFDILLSLIAVQTGVVKDDTSIILPGIKMKEADGRFNLDIASDVPALTLGAAFRTGSANGFAELASRIGKDTLEKWIDSLQYGNKEIGADTTAFWYNNLLKINADQQLGLLKKLYFNQLPFFQRTQEIVRRMMPAENNSSFRLSYKTAQGTKEDGHALGWVMGWVEENKHPYFFVVNLESADPNKDLGAAGLTIAKGILQQLGFFQGKK